MHSLSIRARLFFLVTALSLPFLLALGGALYLNSTRLIVDVQSHNLTLADMVASHLERNMRDSFVMAQELASRPELKRPGSKECHQLMADFKQTHTGFDGITFVDETGFIRCIWNQQIPANAALAELEWFQRVKAEKRPLVSQPYQGRVIKSWIVLLVAPVLDDRGEFRGAVTLRLDLNALRPAHEKQLADHSFITVLSDQGTIVTRSADLEKWVGKNLKGTGLVNAAMRDRHGTARALSATGADTLIGFSTVPSVGWYVITGSNADKILAPARREMYIAAAGGVSLLLIALLVAFTLAGNLSKPIRQLANATRKLAEGDNSVQVREQGPTEIVSLARDFNVMVSARNASAAALAASEGRFRHLLEVLPIGIGLSDENGAIYFRNQRFIDLFGYTESDVATIDQWWVAAYPDPDYRQQVIGQWTAALKFAAQHQSDIRPEEVSVTTRDGLVLHVAISGVLFGAHVLVAFIDLTERKQHEIELIEAKQTAESANKAKSLFLANMSHEIRTPMNAVLGLLQLLQHTELTERQLDYAQKAHAAGTSLLGILNDILDFSKVEAGKLEIEHAPFQLDDVLRNLSVVLSSAVGNKDVEMLFDMEADLPRALYGDSLRLQQVLLNLCGNAIKFTEHGEVVLTLRVVDLSPKQARIEFAIRDTGIGIAPDMLGQIFEGFTQAESSTTRRFGGTGLGLAISLRMVRLMGGELSVQSALGKGSCFSFALAFDRASESALSDTPPSLAGRRSISGTKTPTNRPLEGLRLLLVEDNPMNQQVARELLSHKGAQVAVASNGRQGVERVSQALAAHALFDAVLMDIQMPEMDGYEATGMLRQELHLTTLPIIAMTANAMPADRAACLAAGMNDHVGKPFDLTELVATLQKHTGRGSAPAATSTKSESSPMPESTTGVIAGVTAGVNAAATSSTVPNPPGFELDLALRRLENNRKLYAMLALNFRAEQGQDVAIARGGLVRGERTTAIRTLHTLKGVAGTLGATALSALAKETELAFKDETIPEAELNARLDRLDTDLQAACATLEHIAAALAPPAAPAP